MMRILQTMAITAAIFAAACGDHNPAVAAPPADSGITYQLASVNGALPASTVNVSGDSVRTAKGSLSLLDDGTYVRVQVDSVPQCCGFSTADITWEDHGTWRLTADSVFLTSTMTVVQYPSGRASKTSAEVSVRFGSSLFSYARK